MPTDSWRLLDDGPGPGVRNMAVDRAIRASRAAGETPPTLRLYSFAPSAVSLGWFQDAAGIDLSFCESRGYDVVRRPTGGRGVLHAHEVTYAVAASVEDGIPRGVAASYRYLAEGLARGLARLGVQVEHAARPGGRGSAACFLQGSVADLTAGGRKLCGSAQVWDGATVLQHGSILLSRDVDEEARVFGLDLAERTALLDGTISLSELLGAPVDPALVREAIAEGMSDALGVGLFRSDLTPAEHDLAAASTEEARIPAAGVS